MPLPYKSDDEFTKKRYGHLRSQEDSLKRWEQACRIKWRALALTIKAKLEAVETGITTFESEFLSYTVLPNGKTVAEEILPKLDLINKSGAMPKLLPGMN